MKCITVVKKVQDLYCLGDLKGAEAKLQRFLKKRPRSSWVSENARVYLWLGVIKRVQGDYRASQEICLELTAATESDNYIQASAYTELAMCWRHFAEFKKAAGALEKVRESIREYGDDPLIKAYMPVLLTGAPPPGGHGADVDTPLAGTISD